MKSIVFLFCLFAPIFARSYGVATSGVPHEGDACEKSPIWVSLTTIPSRLPTIGATLATLKEQTLQADQINLCLPPICLKENAPYEVPVEVANDPRINIIHCEQDWGPSTKLLGSLAVCEDPETRIITVDDDKLYPQDLVEKLVSRSEQYPNAAIGFCGWQVEDLLRGRDYFYSHLVYEDRLADPPFVSHVDVLEGYRGVLTKKKFWDDSVYDYANAPKGAFYVDDVWFSGHLARNNISRLAFKYDQHKTLTTYETYGVVWRNNFDEKNKYTALSRRADFFVSNQETALYFGRECWKASGNSN